MRKPDGGYIPVDLEPVFVIEGDGQDKFYAEEEGELTGRAAEPGETQTDRKSTRLNSSHE